MTIKPRHCPPTKQCGGHWISAFFPQKIFQSQESNPGRLGGKRKCYVCAMPTPKSFEQLVSTKAKPKDLLYSNNCSSSIEAYFFSTCPRVSSPLKPSCPLCQHLYPSCTLFQSPQSGLSDGEELEMMEELPRVISTKTKKYFSKWLKLSQRGRWKNAGASFGGSAFFLSCFKETSIKFRSRRFKDKFVEFKNVLARIEKCSLNVKTCLQIFIWV